MSENETPEVEASDEPKSFQWTGQRKIALGCALGFIALVAIAIPNISFFSIQPIGALPEGKTIIILRGQDGQLFDSPDAICLRKMGGVSIMCRLVAFGTLKDATILARLPYQEWAYHLSTDGADFDL